MSNSSLVTKTIPSPNNSGTRTKAICRITPHCVVGQCSINALGDLFANPARRGSSNYGISTTGEVGLFVDESKRSWTSGSAENDQQAVTIECASDTFPPYKFNDKVYSKLVELCADICRRNGKSKAVWISDKDAALTYKLKDDEMLLTVHRWFQPTACPGDWLYSRMAKLASDINATIDNAQNPTIYRVQVGAFIHMKNAQALCDKLKSEGYESAHIVDMKR